MPHGNSDHKQKNTQNRGLADKFERVQYQAGLLVTGGIKNSSYNKILDELGWARFSERVEFPLGLGQHYCIKL
jgi:N-acetylneuraminic acid mutarotase